MANKYYREESKKNYYTDQVITHEDLKLGCLMRIADATELMAQNHQLLIEERDQLQQNLTAANERADRFLDDIYKQQLTIRALRGVITKLKNKAAK